ncbi:MAG: hypothetical protein MZV64_52880 [Ignavibacteriales bacterium]|nr:hypothetical protein [Ignavibacteriales bacterium]
MSVSRRARASGPRSNVTVSEAPGSRKTFRNPLSARTGRVTEARGS